MLKFSKFLIPLLNSIEKNILCYMHEMCVFWNLQKKILSPKMRVEIFLISFFNILKCLVFTVEYASFVLIQYLHVRMFRKFAEKYSKSQNVCWNFLCTMYAVQCRAMWNQCMTRMVSTSFRLCVAETACEVGLLCADSIPCMSACLENLKKKILSPMMCVEIFFNFFF